MHLNVVIYIGVVGLGFHLLVSLTGKTLTLKTCRIERTGFEAWTGSPFLYYASFFIAERWRYSCQ